jgi:hypothetical protein
MANKYGLCRDIPEAIKRAVRQACGFGCVLCGSSIVEYDHVDPEFTEAREHDPARIALVCPQCHSKITTGFWSKEKVKAALATPCCKQTGFSSELFDLGNTHPSIVFAGVTLRNCVIPVMVRDLPLFQISAAEGDNAPFLLTAHFFNAAGHPSLSIQDNEWFASAANWDVEVSGGAITIRDSPRHISLRLVADPPVGLIVENLDMFLYGYHFQGSRDNLVVRLPGGGSMSFKSCLADGGMFGMKLG